MVTLFTNRPEYFADIADEIRLFGFDTVTPAAPEAAFLRVELECGGAFTARAVCTDGERSAEYNYSAAAPGGSALRVKRYEKRAVKIAAFRCMKKLFDAFTPWGSLTGIRPTRLLRELAEDMGCEAALLYMRDEFDVSETKLGLADEIVRVQRPIMDTGSSRDVDVYVGIPFCRTRCLYCSFLSEVRTNKTDMAAYIAALKRDITLGAAIARDAGSCIRSMYMGGGTPTVLTALELEDVLSHAIAAYGGFGCELTVEAGRPDTITREKLEVMRGMGAQRISINPQTMNEKTLELIGRSHGAQDIVRAYCMAREAGFRSINMDMIVGLPGEDIDDVKRTLTSIASLSPENLTVHTLTVKRSSRLAQRLDEFPLPEACEADRMVELGRAAAADMGMRPYYMYRQKYMRGNLENVGYSKPGYECVYNIDMMEETTSIMAHGAGAMSKRIFPGERRVERIPNPKDIGTYINKVDAVAREKAALFGMEAQND